MIRKSIQEEAKPGINCWEICRRLNPRLVWQHGAVQRYIKGIGAGNGFSGFARPTEGVQRERGSHCPGGGNLCTVGEEGSRHSVYGFHLFGTGGRFMNFGIEGEHYDMVDGKPSSRLGHPWDKPLSMCWRRPAPAQLSRTFRIFGMKSSG